MSGHLGSDAVEMLERFLGCVLEGSRRRGVWNGWGMYDDKALFGEVDAEDEDLRWVS